MEIRIVQHKESKKEDILYLKLKHSGMDKSTVILVACDENGEELFCGNILKVSSKGIYRHHSIGDKVLLPKDNIGKIVLSGE